ncbi:MAG: preprotein translocase subunit SecG [Hyphomonadaceae bacterium]
MEIIVLTIHLLVCVALIGLVLLQRSEGGALGMGGGGGGALMSGRGAADALAKMTSVAGGFFLVTSLSLTVLSGAAASNNDGSLFDLLRQEQSSTPSTELPAAPLEADPADARPDPTESSVPAENQLAAILPGPAAASASEIGATRAAPLEQRPAQATTVPASAPAQRPAAQPASTRQPPAAQNNEATTTPVNAQRSDTATTQSPPRTTLNATGARPTGPALTLPNTSGSSGLVAEDPDQSDAESIDVGNGVEAVRRERAGPDR